VSTNLHGVIATNVRAAFDTAFGENWICAALDLSVRRGCQYNGVVQFFNGTAVSRARCAVITIGAIASRAAARPKHFEQFTRVTPLFVSYAANRAVPILAQSAMLHFESPYRAREPTSSTNFLSRFRCFPDKLCGPRDRRVGSRTTESFRQ
jgi:hypothetical protein